MLAVRYHQEAHEAELFQTDEAIKKFNIEAQKLKDKVGLNASGLPIWRMPRISHSKFIRRVMAASKPEEAKICDKKYMNLSEQMMLRID